MAFITSLECVAECLQEGADVIIEELCADAEDPGHESAVLTLKEARLKSKHAGFVMKFSNKEQYLVLVQKL